jgi:hypothetical protein
MPENNELPITPVPVPEPQKPSNIKFYAACIVALGLAITCYYIFGTYKRTKTELTTTSTSLTSVSKTLKETRKAYGDYRRITESNTTWTKTPYIFNGKLVKDGKGNPVYLTSYTKTASSNTSSATTILGDSSSSSAATVFNSAVTHRKEDHQTGVPIQGAVWVAVPFDTFTGKISSLELGINHQFIFDTTVGLTAGSDDLTNLFGSSYLKLLLGHGIP